MRWPRVTRKSTLEPDLALSHQTSNQTSNDDAVRELSPDDPVFVKPPPPMDPGLSRMFSDAALYEKILTACPDSLKDSTFFGADDQALQSCIGGFNTLIGQDLGDAERAVSGRLAKLSVHDWTSSADSSFASPDQLDEEPGELSQSDDGEEEKVSPALDISQDAPPDTTPDEPKLTPDEIVDLLEQEFGALAPLGEEKLLLEADAAFFKDVIILGVVHLTTHRFTFHASLLSSQPDYNRKIIKSGPALIHRKGWHRKTRVWLQLEHDMISSFPSSRDEDRIKPIKSILLSSIKEIKPVDWERPRRIGVVFEARSGLMETFVEFDTLESARDWRNEFNGTIFLYRRNRLAALAMDSNEDVNGIRINIPLHRIAAATKSLCFSFACMVSITIGADPLASNELIPTPTMESDSSSEGNSIDRSETLTGDSDADPIIVQVSMIRKHPLWDDFMSHVESAKARAAADTTEWPGARVYVDFDPRADSGQGESDNSGLNNLQISVSRALGLDTTNEFFIAKAHIHGRFTSNYGHFAANAECIGFWSRSMGFSKNVCYRIPISRVKSVKGDSHCKFGRVHSLVAEVQGRRSFKIHFFDAKKRNDAVENVLRFMEIAQERRNGGLVASPTLLSPTTSVTDIPAANTVTPEDASRPPLSPASSRSTSPSTSPPSRKRVTAARSPSSILAPLSRLPSAVQSARNGPVLRALFPKAINVPEEVRLPMPSKHFVCLTIGSRGDVQPYIALGKGLQKEGHKVTIVTHEEYKEWVTGFGIGHRTAGGDPTALMKLSVENKFRTWLDDLLVDSWEQCKDADVLLESPSAMAGVHIAEALHIPYFRTFTMPWTKTRQFPHAFLSPPVESPTFNAASYVLFDNVLWTATSSQINRWRKHTLGINSTDMGHLAQSKIPFIYNFSQSVVPKPLDWGDATAISGYWFLDNPELNWTPPTTLIDFMAKARADGKPLVYIGFGSITVPNPKLVTERLIRAVQKSDVRAIISKGWSARASKSKDEDDVVFPEECYSLDRVPHDWLFPQLDAVLHHGGAGTTGASLRAGIPTLIRPWFGVELRNFADVPDSQRPILLGIARPEARESTYSDYVFLTEKAGLRVNSLHSTEVANALKKATSNRIMKEKAANVGQGIRSVNRGWRAHGYFPDIHISSARRT
ncbi:glycosyltransferase family 1 protein [Lactarius hatsudake]|nr:glycosyltransferase family 1 protein [Lactarius hatsudake]